MKFKSITSCFAYITNSDRDSMSNFDSRVICYKKLSLEDFKLSFLIEVLVIK